MPLKCSVVVGMRLCIMKRDVVSITGVPALVVPLVKPDTAAPWMGHLRGACLETPLKALLAAVAHSTVCTSGFWFFLLSL